MEEPLECSELAPSASLNPAVHPVGGWRGYPSRALAPLSLRHLHPSCTFGAPTPLHPPGPTRPLGRWHAPSGGPFLPSSGPPGTAAPVRRLRAIGTNRGGRILRRRGRSWRAIARLSDSVGGERPVSGGPRGASADSGSLRGDHWVGSDPPRAISDDVAGAAPSCRGGSGSDARQGQKASSPRHASDPARLALRRRSTRR
jgi:hypothetical protein